VKHSLSQRERAPSQKQANSNVDDVDEDEARYKATVQKGDLEFRKSGWAACFFSVTLNFKLGFNGLGDV